MTTTVAAENIQTGLVSIVGAANVLEAAMLPPELREEFGSAITAETQIASPASAQHVAAILGYAHSHHLGVMPIGSGFRVGTGHMPTRIDILLRTTGLHQLEFYDPGDLTAGFGAGTSVLQVRQHLAQHSQFLPMESISPRSRTIGGVLSTNSHGALRHAFGGVRDYCIGIHFATADGKLVKGGGRVVKNVAGYDLMKLMIGSYGTLGVITSANFKVFPSPAFTRTFIAEFASAKEAVAFRQQVSASALQPIALELLSPRAGEFLQEPMAARDPDVYAPSAPLSQSLTWKVAIRAAGSENVLARYQRELGAVVSQSLDGEKETRWWDWLAAFEESVVARHRNAMIIALDLPASAAASALAAIEAAAVHHNMLAATIGRAALGAYQVALTPMAVDPPGAMQFANVVSQLRGSLPPDATAVVVRCPKEAKAHFDVWGTSPTDLSMMRRVRDALDPKHILNRGRCFVE